jgi:DtxR family Mn-dependent transcriptional regulator
MISQVQAGCDFGTRGVRAECAGERRIMEIWKEFEHNGITHSAAHHLMAIDDLVQRLGYARVSDIARDLHITRGSVSISLRPLKEAGLILPDENKHLRLTESGQRLVTAIKTKRELIRRVFSEVLGVPEPQAEIDACKLEHLISNETARRMVSFLRYFDTAEPPVTAFLAAWRKFDPSCSHEPTQCRVCHSSCMAEAVAALHLPDRN